MNVLGPAIEEVSRDLGNKDQHRWPLARRLSLLAFAEPPSEGIAKIREILSKVRFFYPHDSQGMVAALGASRCAEAMELLLELAKPDGSGVAAIGDAWIKAVAQLGGKRSNDVLLSFVDPNAKLFTKEFLPDHQYGDVLARLMANRAEQDGEFKAELFRLANGDLPPGKRVLLAKTFSRFQGEDDLVAGLCVLRDDGSGFPYELLRSIENAFLERRPYGAEGHAHTLAPRDRMRSETPSRDGANGRRPEAFSICAARPDRGVAARVRASHGRAAASRDRVGFSFADLTPRLLARLFLRTLAPRIRDERIDVHRCATDRGLACECETL